MRYQGKNEEHRCTGVRTGLQERIQFGFAQEVPECLYHYCCTRTVVVIRSTKPETGFAEHPLSRALEYMFSTHPQPRRKILRKE